jgi:AcrR family transcriptional regulator
MRWYLEGRRLDARALAEETGVGRATLYRWFGSREGLLAAVLVEQFLRLLEESWRSAPGRGGTRLLNAMDHLQRRLADNSAMTSLFVHEQANALRLLTSSEGPVQPHAVRAVTELIDRAAAEEDYRPPIDSATLAYALVRLGEAFLYNDAAVGLRGDTYRLRQVQAVLLGVAESGVGEKRDDRLP